MRSANVDVVFQLGGNCPHRGFPYRILSASSCPAKRLTSRHRNPPPAAEPVGWAFILLVSSLGLLGMSDGATVILLLIFKVVGERQ